ncbi:FAD-dependent oxidoreductase [Microbacterium elymi]|uniref:FAD-dependent monooxygenase n=1 Tax=Microbacterium elymi TaxID=2909587 RepID=A0ABY5NI27_9MICO|nr:FAD-dependent oxidoreductase [Microbacterium elymi]UUT34786.1 FAD-dependent monooxygenase [Microbacterium elymi]
MSRPGVRRVLVVGGGFSGLSAAIMLVRAGIDVDLIERSPQWRMDGTGISAGAATLRALHTVGVLDAFLAHGYAADGTDVRTPDGHRIAGFSTPRLVSPEVPGNGAIMRPALGAILVDAAARAGVSMRLGTTVSDLDDDAADGVQVTISDGGRARYDLVVAADGLQSRTRARLFPDAPRPSFSGQGAWRAVVPRPPQIECTTVWVGAAHKVGVNPVSAEEMYLFVNENRADNDHVADDDLVPRLAHTARADHRSGDPRGARAHRR